MCVILALVIIREYVRKNGSPVGPILMLSYKNHALDEFLTDVLKFAPLLKSGDLVRCGKVEHPELVDYSETNSKDEKLAEVALQQCIRTQRTARAASKSWLELARSLEFTTPVAEHIVRRVMELLVRLAPPFLLGEDPDDQEIDDAEVDEADLIPSLICTETPPDTVYAAYADVFGDWVDEVGHWKEVVNRRNERMQVQILLTRWLRGELPPPRCQWADEDGEPYGCDHYCVKEQSFCRVHLCRIAGCTHPCWNDEDGLAAHCEFHICKAPDCIAVRLAAGSYCTDHSCVGCVAEVMAGNLDIEVEMVDAAGSGCVQHRCHKGNCLRACLSPHMYCVDHICLFCAQSQPPANAQPSTRPSGFCVAHECAVLNCPSQRLFSVDDAEYCAHHTCRQCTDAVDLSCENAAQSLLCADHRCAYPGYLCQHEVLETDESLTERCEYHSCRVCVVGGDAAKWREIVEDFPRNVCDAHPLCVCPVGANDADVILCGECAVPGAASCAEHIDADEKKGEKDAADAARLIYTGVCHGLTKKGAKCKTKCPVAEQLYCDAHVSQAVGARAEAAVARRPLPVPVNRQQVMQTAQRAKVNAYMVDLQQNEETVKRSLFAHQMVQCSHEGCGVHALLSVTQQRPNQWRCALHTAVRLPLAPMEPEEEEKAPTEPEADSAAVQRVNAIIADEKGIVTFLLYLTQLNFNLLCVFLCHRTSCFYENNF